MCLFFKELRQYILRGKVKIYACPKAKGIEFNTWNDLENSFNGLFYKLDKSGDFVIISPILLVKATNGIAFPIKMIGSQRVSTFVPVHATLENFDGNIKSTHGPFDLGLTLRGEIQEYDISDVNFVRPVQFKCSSAGKVQISGTWTKFSNSGYVVMGGIY